MGPRRGNASKVKDVKKVNKEIIEVTADDNYNNFFHPNICHICKRFSDSLILCDCYMISYCSTEHKLAHKEEHQWFCRYLTEYLIREKGAEWRTIRLSTPEWVQCRLDIMNDIHHCLPRELVFYEKQMILLAKSCRLCHQQHELHTCQWCYFDNYCSEHEQAFREQHKPKCRLLRTHFNLEIIRHTCKIQLTCSRLTRIQKLVGNMNYFIKKYVRCLQGGGVESWVSYEYFYSDYISGPLTLNYWLRQANIYHLANMETSQYIIHIIAENPYEERKHISGWRVLFHILKYLKQLKIVLIGPELKTEKKMIKLCPVCEHKRNRKFNFETCSLELYQDYMKQWTSHIPNVILGIEIDFSSGILSFDHISLLRKMFCPLILTAASKSIARNNIIKIHQWLNPLISPVCNAKNKFKSIKPTTNFTTGSVWYRNEHVTIYKNLYPELKSL